MVEPSRSTSRALAKSVRPVKAAVVVVAASVAVAVVVAEVSAVVVEVAVAAVDGAAVVAGSAANEEVAVVVAVDGAAAVKNAAAAAAVIATDFRALRPWPRLGPCFRDSAKVMNSETYPNPASAGPHSVRFPWPIGQSH